MNAIEQRIATLKAYMPLLTAKDDLERFWVETLAEFADKPLRETVVREATPLAQADVYAVTYEGFDDTPIHGWYILPKSAEGSRVPCVVTFHGYHGGKGYPEQYSQWLLMGYGVFAIDIRGQGGETGNRLASEFGMTSGWVSQGILDKRNGYYMATTIDCLKAVEWVSKQERIDPAHIYVTGSSQGGGLALLTAALSDKPALVVANVPNLCHMDFGMLNSTGSLTELSKFTTTFPDRLAEVLDTVSYFDVMNMAERIRIPVMISVGLKDTICMPETVYAAYNRMTCQKEIHPYPFMGHTNIGYHNRLAMRFMEQYQARAGQ
ncbi:acetylxylan esterase [Paenibacillus sp. MBLB4367]|uniref:acetylxylan esterase n=1 Tax=Paenibacillus sp. MBLB4367 TaxID=3384767 RepID=UPI003908050E